MAHRGRGRPKATAAVSGVCFLLIGLKPALVYSVVARRVMVRLVVSIPVGVVVARAVLADALKAARIQNPA